MTAKRVLGRTAKRAARLGMLAGLMTSLVACEDPFGNTDRGSGDDDDSGASGDDDDTSPAPTPLGDVIGVFNLTNVVQGPDSSYVDFSGAFGTFVKIDSSTLSPAAYLSTFSYGADAAYWRSDLGGYPLPAEGESWTGDLYTYYPFVPAEQSWWDGGRRIGVGNYLSTRLDFEDVTAYQVDDPLVPGAASWSPEALLSWANDPGEDLTEATLPDSIPLPQAVELLSPIEGLMSEAPAAHDLLVQWNPGTDGSTVTVGLLSPDGIAYIATVPDTGSHSIPSSVLEGTFGASTIDLSLARTLETALPHPQGDILFRSREERRAQIELLSDLVLEPSYGEAGQTLDVSLRWFTGSINATTTVDFGAGITVLSITPDSSSTHQGQVRITVAADAATGPRNVTITTGGATEVLTAGFSVLDLLPSNDCTSASTSIPLSDGTYSSTTHGLSNDITSGISCMPWTLNGSDAVYPIFLNARETLIATMTQPEPADGALALLASCGEVATAVACADTGLSGDPETLVFTAETPGTYYLVIDSYAFTGTAAVSSPFDLVVSVEQEVLSPAWIVPGKSQDFQLHGSTNWSSSIESTDLQLGAGVTASTAAPASTDARILDFTASAVTNASPGVRDVVVNDPSLGSQTFPGTLWVSGWPSYDHCSSASAAPGLGSGESLAYAVSATNRLGSVSCLQWPSNGPELFFPLDLNAGDRVDAGVRTDYDAQLYVVQDCNDGSTCITGTGVDDTVDGEWEYLIDWVPSSTGRYYLVVDLYTSPLDPLDVWSYELNLMIQ